MAATHIITLSDKAKIKKIIHISDIHIHDDREEEYNKVYDDIINKANSRTKKNSTMIVITGDTIDSIHNITISIIRQIMSLLKRLGDIYPIVIIPGNHDVNVYNSREDDIIELVSRTIKAKNSIYYLKNTGLYRYGNIVFSHSSVFDNILHNASEIPDTYIKIALYHGYVHDKSNKTLRYMLFKKHKTVDDFNGYDYVLLGDIHKKLEINDKIAYASNIVQQNYGEREKDTGFLIWDIEKKSKEYIIIYNEYLYGTIEITNNIITDRDNLMLEKNRKIRLRIRHDNININDNISGIINKLNENNTVIEINRENTNSIVNREIRENINILDIDEITEELRKNILNDVNEIDENSTILADMMERHRINYKNININITDKKLRLIKLEFENMFCFKSRNTIDFTDIDNNNKIWGLIARNYHGKSSIFDIILYALYQKTSNNGSPDLNDILNKESDRFELKLEFAVNNSKYIITNEYNKNNKGDKKHRIELFKCESDIITKMKLLTKSHLRETIEKIQNIVGITYEQFMTSNMMAQTGNKTLLEMSNQERKDTIYKYLNLDIFDKLNSECKKLEREKEKEMDEYNILLRENKKLYETTRNINVDELDSYIAMKDKLDNDICDKYKLMGNYKIDESLKMKIEDNNMKIEDNVKNIIILREKNDNYKVMIEENKRIMDNYCGKNACRLIIEKMSRIKMSEKTRKEVINIVNSIGENTEDKTIEDITKWIQEKNKIENEIIEREHQNNILNVDNNRLEREINEQGEIYIILGNIADSITELKNKLDDITDKITIIKQCKKMRENTIINIDNLEKKIRKGEIINRVIKSYIINTGTNGMPYQILKKVCTRITDNINNILGKFSTVRMKMQCNETGKKTVVDIYKTNDNTVSSIYISGYERMAIDIAMKIALTEIPNININVFMIDEAFACTDKINKIELKKLVEILRNNFEMTIIVSHDDDIRCLFDNELTIKKTGSTSHISCNL